MSATGSTLTPTIITAKRPACSVTFLITTLITRSLRLVSRTGRDARYISSNSAVHSYSLVSEFPHGPHHVIPWSHNSEVIFVIHFAISRLAEREWDAIPREMIRFFQRRNLVSCFQQHAFK